MKEYDENLMYIKKFAKISISNICKKLRVSAPNLYNGHMSKEKTKAIREEIESEIAKLYLKLDIEEEQK